MINGVINIYKEKGYTSADVVAKLRGILHQKKIGHTGTLDPEAEGVLPVCLGYATKLVDHLTDKRKEYICTLRLGVTTDTEDMTGEILSRQEVSCSNEELISAIRSFEGEYDQVPPMYSALKQNGRRLYELAREGVVVERPARRINIFDIGIKEISLPTAVFRVECSKGTYIRSLCRDIGEKLGCGGAMEKLLRSKSGEFTLDSALKLSEVEQLVKAGEFGSRIVLVEHFYSECPAAFVRTEDMKFLKNGNPLPGSYAGKCKDGQLVRVYDDTDKFCAVYRYDEAKGSLKADTIYELPLT
ncbi:MAG: tRNA pseudouridine(55) synthase TruB [Lachnospiraceae bacterium]|nr:tRNA pseudouridine(55) synthase TruB [Lachnospiraceae bacterium]